MDIFLVTYIIIQIICNLLIEIVYRLIIKYKDIDAYKSIGELERDINVKYTPAIVSMLYDNRIETSKDITAVILNLSLKGYISINKDRDGKYKIKPNLQSNPINNIMCPEEKYVYEWLIQNKKFNFVEWVNIIKKEYNKANFVKTESKSKKRNSTISLIVFIISIMLYFTEVLILLIYYLDNILAVVIGVFIVPMVMIMTVITVNKISTNSFVNNWGNEEVTKWTKFKRFMHNYTLIDDKNPEAIAIYEKYIPYSIALNVNKKYKTIWKDLVPQKERFEIKLHYSILENIVLKPIMKLGQGDDSVSKYYK